MFHDSWGASWLGSWGLSWGYDAGGEPIEVHNPTGSNKKRRPRRFTLPPVQPLADYALRRTRDEDALVMLGLV
jgi:hypothetical protein